MKGVNSARVADVGKKKDKLPKELCRVKCLIIICLKLS